MFYGGIPQLCGSKRNQSKKSKLFIVYGKRMWFFRAFFCQLNGVTTLGENIADYGGVRESFRAYRHFVAVNGVEPPLPGLESFTSEQIFFLTFANTYCGVETPEKLMNQIMTDPHSPNRFRVIGTLSNSEDFVREFSCPPNSPMNRLHKCLLWR